jgi:hypothetical protein
MASGPAPEARGVASHATGPRPAARHRPAPSRPGARVTTGDCVIYACRRGVLLLRADGDAARSSCGSVHRSRDFGISRRGDALDAARPRLSEPAGLGPCGRPDRRVATLVRKSGGDE